MKSMQRRIKGIILFVCCIIYLFVGIQPMYTKAAEDNDHATENPIWVDSPSIMGESGIVMEVSTGTILYEKNMHDIHYPASITKIMTVLLAIENCEMDEIVTVPPEAVYMEDKGSHIALDAGEQLTVEQCLYAIMLASANDAAYALAEHVGGTYENFIRMMNEEAKELGCENTNFTNPHGLPDENHVTSAYDMALITKAALQCDMFQTVSGTSYYEILPTEHQKDLNIIKPYLVYQAEATVTFWMPGAFSKETAKQVLEGTKKVVNDSHGTGYAAHRDDIVLAGKTGTAEIKASKDDTSGTELGWFAIYSTEETVEHPILIISMVEDVKGRGGSGYVVKKDSAVLEDWFHSN